MTILDFPHIARYALWVSICFMGSCFQPATASDTTPFAHDRPMLEGRLERVEPGHTLLLKDGRRLVLAGTWPLRRLYDGGDGVEDGLAIMADLKLAALDNVQFVLTEPDPDRYGRLKALVRTDQGRWLSLILLEEGLAYAFPVGENPDDAAIFYATEAKARIRRKGLWAHPPLSTQRATAITAAAGTFAVIEGHVTKATKVGGTVYLNFGTDWRQDFTIRLNWPLRRQYPKAERAPQWWQGRQVEVRGVLEDFNGPLVTPLDPAQIRILPASPQ